MSTDAPLPARDAEDSDTLAPTLARPEGVAPSHAALDVMFGPTTHDGEVGTFARYRVLKKLGQGGMGAVYLGYDAALDRKVALKVMLPALAADPESRERFLREARSAAKVKSDHTVIIYEVSQERGIPFIAMEYLLGMPLDQYLKTKGDVPLLHAMRVGREVALGLVAVHELGLVHRDIKPANVWLEAPKGRAKLLDFGLARSTDDTIQLTGTGMVVGTVAYMSPEQGRGEKVDHRSDLFSLGVMMYRLTTGKMPFNGTSAMALLTSLAIDTPPAPRQLNPNIPPKLEAVITRLLAKKPADRFQNALAAADALLDATRPDPTAEHAPLVAVPLVVGAQTQSVWEGIEVSESVAVPLADRDADGDEYEGESSVAPRPARAQPSKLPLFAAVGALALAAAAVGAVLAWPKKKPDVAQVEPDKPVVGERPKAPADADRKVAGWVLGQGGFVTVAAKGERFDLRKGDPLPAGPFAVEEVDLAGIKAVTNDDLKQLSELKSLAELDLSGTGVTNGGMAHVGRLANLRWLSLSRTGVHDAGVAELHACKSLVYVDLSFTSRGVKIDAFNALDGCDKLEILDLRAADIGVVGHHHIRTTRPKLVTDPNRRGAESVFALGGVVRVTGGAQEVTAAAGLPPHNVSVVHATLDTTNKPREQVAPAVAALGRCKELESLTLTGPNVIDGDLIPFKRARGLKQLDLSGTATTDAGLFAFRNCSRLEALRLQNTKVTDAGLAQFAFGPLVLLDVRGTGVTAAKVAELQKALPTCKIEADSPKFDDRTAAEAALRLGGKIERKFTDPNGTYQVTGLFSEGAPWTDETLSRFAGCKTLRWANLSDTKVTDACLAFLKDSKGMSGLLLSNTKVADAGLVHLKEITGLQALSLDGTAVTDAGLAALKECQSLTALGLSGTKVTAKGVDELQKALPKCKIDWIARDPDRAAAEWVLSVGGAVGVGGVRVTAVEQLPAGPFKLNTVDLIKRKAVTDADLARLSACDGLTEVNVSYCSALTDAGLAHLAACRSLESVQFGYCAKVTDAGLAHFKGNKRLTSIGVFGCTAATDAGLAHFAGCANLSQLNLGYCAKVTDAGLAHFAGCARLKHLNLHGLVLMTDAGLAHFAGCRQLELVKLTDCARVTDAGLAKITFGPILTLDITGTRVTAAKVAELQKALPKCNIRWDDPSKK